MTELTVQEWKDRKFKIRKISWGIAEIVVGVFVVSLGGAFAIVIGVVLAIAGLGTIIEASHIKL